MILLDKDALGHLQERDPARVMIRARLDASADQDPRITAVTAYEMVGGAGDPIDRRKKARRDVLPASHLLQDPVEDPGLWRGRFLPYEATAEGICRGFPARSRQGLKDDARIAAVAPARGAAVRACNASDDARVPGLAVVRAETGAGVP